MGGAGQTIEIDETYIGKIKGMPKSRGGASHKNNVLSLVNRDTGEARSFHVSQAAMADTLPIVLANVRKESTVYTDEGLHHKRLIEHFAVHDAVNHAREEYVRGNVSTNRIEGFSQCSSVA